MQNPIVKIVVPTRAQADTSIAVYLLKKYGGEKFPGVTTAEISVAPMLKEGTTFESALAQGELLIDLAGGLFDHHNHATKITVSTMVAQQLGILHNPSIKKMLVYAERDDFYGKGTISNDPIDRAFGLSALLTVLNKKYVSNPVETFNIILPIITAHHEEELRRTEEMPKELKEKLANGSAENFSVIQRGKQLKVLLIDTDNPSMAGYVRSVMGGGYDVAALRLSSGHLNILTRPAKQVDLQSLAVILRTEEASKKKIEISHNPVDLAQTGRYEPIPEWYYDPATNSLQNGGIVPGDVPATGITKLEARKLLELGLSEQLWNPLSK